MKFQNAYMLLFFVLLFNFAAAQQDSQYSQYMYNTQNINPAYAGSRGALSVFALHRSQWLGLEGAPKTFAAALNSPLRGSNLGVGFSLVSDKIGPTDETDFSADLSYSIPTSAFWTLSFGIKATAEFFSLDPSKLNPENQNDPQLQNLDSDFSPNIGAGIYWHSDKAYVGLSVPGFIQTSYYDHNDLAIYKNRINYCLIGGYVFDFSSELKFKPAVLAKAVEGAPLQVDASANFLFFDKLTLGLSYRWDAAVSALAGFQISDQLHVGYSYDSETSRLRNYNSGSHEIFIRYEFLKNSGRVITPRFF